jgi:RNA polymerase sigma-70 factor (ECF subfamily)
LNKKVDEAVFRTSAAEAEPTEAEIVQKVLAGETAAYGEIFLRHRGRAFALAYQYLRDREEAMDVVQDAFIKAYQNLGKFSVQRRFGPWLLTIVRNLSIDTLRKRKRISPDGLPEVVPDPGSGERTVQKVLKGEVWKALQELSPDQREIIFLKDYQGHSYVEISQIVDIPLGTVMSRLHHARKNLAAALSMKN